MLYVSCLLSTHPHENLLIYCSLVAVLSLGATLGASRQVFVTYDRRQYMVPSRFRYVLESSLGPCAPPPEVNA